MRKHVTLSRLILLLVVLAAGGLALGSLAAAESALPETAVAPTETLTTSCSGSFCLNWSVVAGGMAPMASDSFQLRATVGQSVAGLFSGDTYRLHSGYWVITLGEREYYIYIPSILRE
jgi:hypothetical protein